MLSTSTDLLNRFPGACISPTKYGNVNIADLPDLRSCLLNNINLHPAEKAYEDKAHDDIITPDEIDFAFEENAALLGKLEYLSPKIFYQKYGLTESQIERVLRFQTGSKLLYEYSFGVCAFYAMLPFLVKHNLDKTVAPCYILKKEFNKAISMRAPTPLANFHELNKNHYEVVGIRLEDPNSYLDFLRDNDYKKCLPVLALNLNFPMLGGRFLHMVGILSATPDNLSILFDPTPFSSTSFRLQYLDDLEWDPFLDISPSLYNVNPDTLIESSIQVLREVPSVIPKAEVNLPINKYNAGAYQDNLYLIQLKNDQN